MATEPIDPHDAPSPYAGPRPYEYLEQWLAALVESLDDAVMSKDLNSIIMSWNGGAERLFGFVAQEVVGKPVTILFPAGRYDEESGILERIRRGEAVGSYETVRQHKDGSPIDVSLKVSPIKLRSGEVVGASTIMHDIAERKRAREQQELLLREMSHRVTNVLAVANGLVGLSALSATDPKAMAKAIQERLGAFAAAHELTRPGLIGGEAALDQRTTIKAVIKVVTAPYARLANESGRDGVVVEGDDIALSGSAVTGLALVLHEFATNAAKYGALSVPSGSLRIFLAVDGKDFVLIWQEKGGACPGAPPTKEGFGAVLTRRTVTGQFDGAVTHNWTPTGLTITLRLALSRLT